MKAFALATVSALALVACAPKTPEPVMVSEINVTADLGAVTSRQAVSYWQNVTTDVEAALAAEFVGRIDPSGRIVNVDIDEISLTNALTPGAGEADARLTGVVTVENPDGTSAGRYNVTATSSQVESYLPEGTTTIPATTPEYYRAIVQAFARGTAEVVAAGGA